MSQEQENARLRLILIVAGTFAFLGAIGILCETPREQLPFAGKPDVAPAVAPPAPIAPPSRPADVEQLPPRAFFGYDPHPLESRRFVASLKQPTLRDAAPTLFNSAQDDSPVLLYRALYEASPGWRVGKQGIGDCVSWGWAHAADTLLAVELKLGQTGEWQPAATEAIYGGSRVEAVGRKSGGWGDGSYGAAAAKWVSNYGIVFRAKYGDVDLTTYSAQTAKQWGNYGCGGSGDNGRLDTIAKEHPIKTVALVTNFDELAAAIKNGYPVPVCSGQGFSSQRDSQGFARASGSWSHCMCFIAVRFDRPGALCLNSWGTDWIRGPKSPEDQPDGSFWVDAKTVTSMLRGRDSFAVSNYVGFPPRKLDHSKGW